MTGGGGVGISWCQNRNGFLGVDVPFVGFIWVLLPSVNPRQVWWLWDPWWSSVVGGGVIEDWRWAGRNC